jgi:hypothetical protein
MFGSRRNRVTRSSILMLRDAGVNPLDRLVATKGVREDTRKRLIACVVGATS